MNCVIENSLVKHARASSTRIGDLVGSPFSRRDKWYHRLRDSEVYGPKSGLADVALQARTSQEATHPVLLARAHLTRKWIFCSFLFFLIMVSPSINDSYCQFQRLLEQVYSRCHSRLGVSCPQMLQKATGLDSPRQKAFSLKNKNKNKKQC